MLSLLAAFIGGVVVGAGLVFIQLCRFERHQQHLTRLEGLRRIEMQQTVRDDLRIAQRTGRRVN